MINLFHAVSIFGFELDVDVTTLLYWLVAIQAVLIVIAVIVLIALILRSRRKAQAAERILSGITLDTEVVKRNFGVGEEFECDGLVINARYTAAPDSEFVTEYAVLTQGELDGLKKNGKEIPTCYVVKPDTANEGKIPVTVVYGEKTAVYMISVGEVAAAPVVEKEVVRVIQEKIVMPAQEEVAVAAAPVPAVRKFVGICIDTANVKKEYAEGEEFTAEGLIPLAVYDCDGKPAVEPVEEYEIAPVDMKKGGEQIVLVSFCGHSVGYKIHVDAPAEEPAPVELVEEPVAEEIAPAAEEPVEEEPAPVEEAAPEAVRVAHEPIIIEEESLEAGTLRYDRSFTARLIQSDDETKNWYTELKNGLLSYKKFKARMSWKRETYRCGKEPVALLAYRGKTLCVFLPLNPADFAESKYKVEDVSDNTAYADTPCMYRIKNARRVQYALELVALVAERLNAPKIEIETQDYYLPYEGIVELIGKGLVKRRIKSAADEAVFNQNN